MSTFWIICIFVITGEFQPFSDALFMWTAPPPAWNQTNAADIKTTSLRVLNGTTNYQVSWHYSLFEGQSIRITTFSILLPGSSRTDDIGDVINGSSSVNDKDDYVTRFKLESTSKNSTLTINKVTENATYQCKIRVGGNTWAYNVRIEVTGKRPVISTTSPPIGKTTPSPTIGEGTSKPTSSNPGNAVGSIVGAVLGPIAVISFIF